MRPKQWRPSNALRKRRTAYYSLIEVSGLAGIMVFLLVLFILPPMINTHPRGVSSIDMPTTVHAQSQPGALKEDSLEIAVTRDGGVFLQNRKITVEDIPTQIHEWVLNGSDPKVYLRVDARAYYGDVKAVIAMVRASGVDHIDFLVSQRDPSTGP